MTGKAPMFDRSVFGFWQCREKYATQDELLTNAREMKRRQIPLDYIVQDWDYWPKDMRGPEWDRSRYPNPTEMLKELDNLDIKLMVSVWPSFTNEPLLKKYGLDGKKMGEGNNFLDFYDSEVPDKFYRMLSDSMFHIGVTSIWLDGTEPESKPIDSTITGAGEFGAVANPYSLLVVKAMYEGKRKEFPNERVFNLTRSSYAGQQRFGVTTWSGDVEASWEQFSEQIPAGLNLMMAGIPYWTTDIGGFFRDKTSLNKTYDNQYTNKEYIELLTRWFQFGTFNPIFRLHGFKSNTEIWNYTPEFEAIARKFIDIRYQLIPYIYSASWNVTKNGRLMMSPLVYQYPDDKATWAIKDQFMLGESILVNPVIEYKARSRKLYLPKGEWYDYWTNELIEGGRWIEAKAELESLPLYVKAGSIIPMSEKVQHSSEQLGKPITLKIYPNKDADYTLYIDDTESYNYENGEYSEIEIKYNDANKNITICTPTNVEYFKKEIGSIDFNIEVVGVDSQIKSIKFIGDEVLEKI
ncbi:MAG: glycoside hydrolase family 31 protein [Rikenellaceae bacterium]